MRSAYIHTKTTSIHIMLAFLLQHTVRPKSESKLVLIFFNLSFATYKNIHIVYKIHNRICIYMYMYMFKKQHYAVRKK